MQGKCASRPCPPPTFGHIILTAKGGRSMRLLRLTVVLTVEDSQQARRWLLSFCRFLTWSQMKHSKQLYSKRVSHVPANHLGLQNFSRDTTKKRKQFQRCAEQHERWGRPGEPKLKSECQATRKIAVFTSRPFCSARVCLEILSDVCYIAGCSTQEEKEVERFLRTCSRKLHSCQSSLLFFSFGSVTSTVVIG